MQAVGSVSFLGEEGLILWKSLHLSMAHCWKERTGLWPSALAGEGVFDCTDDCAPGTSMGGSAGPKGT